MDPHSLAIRAPDAEQLADVHWRSISRDNVLTIYGADANSRIADPDDPKRIFSWLISETRDDKGNAIRYLYKPEDGIGAPLAQAHQRNRGGANGQRRSANRYIHRILYGNREPLLDGQGHRPRRLSDLPEPPGDTAADWLFEVRFDYGELDIENPTGQPETVWSYRPDAFSSYRAGFEVRTCRRCERVLMLHHIPDQPAAGDLPETKGYAGVVRSTEFVYDDELTPALATRPVYSFLKQVVQIGWKQEGDTTIRRRLPPLEFRYSKPEIVHAGGRAGTGQTWRTSRSAWTAAPTAGSICTGRDCRASSRSRPGQWLYKRNLSPVSQHLRPDRQPHVATLAPLETVASRPNASIAAGAQILDLAGDGQPDVVTFTGPSPGLYEHDGAEGWEPFRAFRYLPEDRPRRSQPALRRPRRRRPCRSADHRGRCPRLAPFAGGRRLRRGSSGCRCPGTRSRARGCSSPTAPRSIHLADLSGDGLSDLVRIRNGDVCYWPNLGYGRFGAKVTMDNAPLLRPSGAVRPEAPRCWPTSTALAPPTSSICTAKGYGCTSTRPATAGARPRALPVFPPIHDAARVTALDLLGNGTACLVWSSPLPSDAGRPDALRQADGRRQASSAHRRRQQPGRRDPGVLCLFAALLPEDKLAGNPWITRLPFPVQVVERVETDDHISRNRFVTRYAYHHGYFDGDEREFRGFGDGGAVGHRGARRAESGGGSCRWEPTSMPPPMCRRCTPRPGSTPASTSDGIMSRTSLPDSSMRRTEASTTASRVWHAIARREARDAHAAR